MVLIVIVVAALISDIILSVFHRHSFSVQWLPVWYFASVHSKTLSSKLRPYYVLLHFGNLVLHCIHHVIYDLTHSDGCMIINFDNFGLCLDECTH